MVADLDKKKLFLDLYRLLRLADNGGIESLRNSSKGQNNWKCFSHLKELLQN